VNSLPPDAVDHLYPVLMIVVALFAAFSFLIGGLWAGFRWLKGQIKETAEELLRPVVERIAIVERTADAAHRRIDEIVGRRP